jgi:hypothetical protein
MPHFGSQRPATKPPGARFACRLARVKRTAQREFTLGPMRTVVAFLVAAVSGIAPLERGGAAPPEDIAAQCRASFPQVPLQVRCSYLEHAAAQRVTSAASSGDSDLFSRCLAASQSWSAMENCLAGSARTSVSVAGRPPVSTRSPRAPGDAGAPPASPEVAGPPADAAPTPDAVDAPSSTPGLPAAAPTAVVEPERPTRPISEADAERQLRAVLERVGYPWARCIKKQYGPGWASICE